MTASSDWPWPQISRQIYATDASYGFIFLLSRHVDEVQYCCTPVLPARRSKRGICYGNVAGWLGGLVSVTRRYCIKKVKHILKLFRSSGIILFSSDSCADTQFQGELHQRGVKYTGEWEKLAIFDGNRRISRKRCDICRWLLWNVNRKPWVPDWMVSSPMTLSDP